MKKLVLAIVGLLISLPMFAQSTLDCSMCHSDIVSQWNTGPHSTTQLDVADELAGERAGQTPDEVINGADAENCIACHGALGVTKNGGMTEVQALSYFFSTENGVFSANTQALNTNEWPNVACVTCHDVPGNHPAAMPTFGIYDSRNAAYTSILNTSKLCGQCHGSLRFAETDHLREDAWLSSKHGHGGQDDVAEEIVENDGLTPAEIIADEDCIACHASTSVLLNGGMSEAEALSYFFTTTDGKITSTTTTQNTDMWTEVACIACHNPHKPDDISYFNSATKDYEVMSSSEELCGQCHGTLRFPDTDHLSYNIQQGTGAIGVADAATMPGIKCVDCHMHSGEEDTKSAMFGGHSWEVFITEDGGTVNASCSSSNCHPSMDVNSAMTTVNAFKDEFANLDSIANVKVADAVTFLEGSSDATKLQMLEDAQFNLAFAEGDESGGVHNHNYTKAILNNVIEKANDIVTGVSENPGTIKEFALYQNYPNPFNPTTTIEYAIPRTAKVELKVYDLLGNEIVTLVSKEQPTGNYMVQFDGANLSSGIYFYKITAGNFAAAKKLILMK